MSVQDGVEIRPYRPEDRLAIHQISFDTGMMGESIGSQWRDLRSWAEVNTGYYLDEEPESTIVADVDGNVVGYLLGCFDSEKATDPIGIAAKHAFGRGLLFRPGTAGILWRHLGEGARDVILGRVKPSDWSFEDPRWPAHLHINVNAGFRGQGLGSLLIEQWLDRLREEEVPGCHIETQTEGPHTNAMTFFEQHGFESHGKLTPVPGQRSTSGNQLYTRVMVRGIETI